MKLTRSAHKNAPTDATPVEVATTPYEANGRESQGLPLVAVQDASRSFGPKQALDHVSLEVRAGEIRALLGPNGAGKTTLLRILTGLVLASAGHVRVAGFDPSASDRALRRSVGLVPSGDRSFYLRISGLENLAFFGRLYGFTRKQALSRVHEVLDEVGLLDAARLRVGAYSHGMQKRLSVARALLTDPPVLLVDEATHDLDPEGAERVRALVRARAHNGTAVLWATQRLDEIRGFADTVTVLNLGVTGFNGTVPELLMKASTRRFVLTLNEKALGQELLDSVAAHALAGLGSLDRIGGAGSSHYLLSLEENIVLGDALAALTAAGIQILGCHAERSEVEEAFLSLIRKKEL